ncbi:MAG: succinate dehydrogenase membrane anchor subunit [Gammaproteobacteria bacterium]|nr:MAG: succinate dehydrogenase membrane anchor subunit [Gammaproteobacteria bacterium]
MKYVTQGLRMWLLQRLTAVYMVLFFVFMLGYFFTGDKLTFANWTLFMSHPLTTTAWVLFFLSLLLHAWVGMRDAIMDYVNTFWVKLFVLSMLAVGLISMGIWAIRVLLMAGSMR